MNLKDPTYVFPPLHGEDLHVNGTVVNGCVLAKALLSAFPPTFDHSMLGV